ncbi:MAG: HAMP domain-containing sensor histidine kinase [Luteolibacter sp.]|uniref:sensor histidine kinase n=1 Tax=Luteolibacter sp. TaxID=1962973 RepID=UPI003266693E
MNIRKSIRWRIQSWHAMLLLAMCAGFGVTAYRLEKTNALHRADQDLEIRLSALTSALSQGGGRPDDRRPPPDDLPPEEEPRDGPPQPPGFGSSAVTGLFDSGEAEPFYYQVWTRRGTLLDRSSTAPDDIPLPGGSKDLEKSASVRNGFRELHLFTPPGECLLVGRATAGMERELRDLAWKLTGIGMAVLAFGLAVGWWIATRALQPVSQISEAATRIAAGNLKERIRTSETESELGQLGSLLNNTFQRLDTAFEEQARFTSDAAHELRTPVSIILAQSQLSLGKERGAAEYRETIEISQRAAKRMHALIESLLQLSVIDASGTERNLQSADLRDITAEQITLMGTLAAEKNMALVSDLNPAACTVNPEQIGQIVVNLLTNAVKFSPPGSEIKISTRIGNSSAVLTVSDNGPGIPDHHLPHLFERFYRVDASRNRATGGAGLGLAICKRIAEAHGGNLTVESHEGKGSSFTLTIPHKES